MATEVTYITTQGAILAAKTLEAKTLKFSKFAIGDGEITDTNASAIKALTDLSNFVLNFDITKISRDTDTQVTVRGLFQNTDAESSFYLRELGLYAIDPDTNEEILFAYINYGDKAEYINNSISAKKEHYFDMVITVDNADNVSITTDPTTVYITEKDLNELKEIVVAPNAGAHNAIYRGKDITELFYDGTLSKQIANGTFDDIYPGDYIVGKSSGNIYLVADLDYYYLNGDTACTAHHLTLVPLAVLTEAQMNSTNITTGAYVGSEMYTTHLASCKTIIQNDFGTEHILKHRNHLQNAVTNGYPSGGTWYDSDIELMSEVMVYGTKHFAAGTQYSGSSIIIPNNYTIEKSQLALFRHRPSLIIAKTLGITDINSSSRRGYWLRDVVSSSNFALVNSNGNASYNNASDSNGVRPAFSII